MEVLGTYAGNVKDGIKEVRLRFSRCKFWLAAGARLTKGSAQVLADAGLIPKPPALHGSRNQKFNESLAELEDQLDKIGKKASEIIKNNGNTKGIFID
jgi:ribosomal protein S16